MKKKKSPKRAPRIVLLGEGLLTTQRNLDFLVMVSEGHANNIAVLTRRVVELEGQLAQFNMTPKEKLLQLRNGLKYLTDFANELQRDIDK